VTGTLNPDVTGEYSPIGTYNGKPSYELAGNGWFLWWNGVATWFISSALGFSGEDWWERVDPNIEGLYTNEGTATGDATVTKI